MKLRDGKRTLGWTVALAAIGIVLCVTPLFDVLGYESCLALALAAAFAGAHLAAARVWRARHDRAPSDALRAEAHPLQTIAMLYTRSIGHIWALLSVPLLLLLANALRVRSCDPASGFVWFLMLPLLSGALGAALGVCLAIVFNYRRQVIPTLLTIAFILGSIAWGVWRFYAAPPIFGFDPFVGYFAGTLYDEEVTVPGAFIWARLYQLGLAATALSLAALLLDGETMALEISAARGRIKLAMVPIVFAIVSGFMFHNRARLGFELDAGDIARALGAEKRTPHFVLHYSPRGPYAKDIDAFASDDEFRWQQLEKFFGHAPEPPVHAFLFDSADQKRQLMGAAHTFIAKPWRRETYLQYEAWPQQVTAHELAHVFAGQFGDGLFGIARKGLHFNVGLIEGIAVAASWAGQPLTPHQTVAVLRDARLVDPSALGQVMSPRFFGLNAGQAYALAGSFVRFLIDTRGVDKLERLFHEAGSDESYRAIYDRSFEQLRDEWWQRIGAEAVPADERALTAARLKRPSVFHRACAHALALARQRAHGTAAGGDRMRALADFEALCREEPGDTNALADALDAALAADARPAAHHYAEAILQRNDPVLAAKAEMALGDLALLDGDDDGARLHYARAARLPMDEGSARLVTVKQAVAALPRAGNAATGERKADATGEHETDVTADRKIAPGDLRAALVQFLATPAALHDQAIDLMTLRALVDAHPERALLHYLLARQLAGKGRHADVVAELTHPTADRLPDARFERESARILGQSLFRLARWDEARAVFEKLARDSAADPGARLDAEDWLARIAFTTRAATENHAATPETAAGNSAAGNSAPGNRQ